MAGFILNDTLVKVVSDSLPLGQIILVRGILSIFLITAICHLTGGFGTFGFVRQRHVLLRAAAETLATVLYLTALFHLPIANATAILQALPLMVTAGAAIFLNNRVGWRRWTAIAIGFAGVVVIVRPGLEGFNSFSLFAVAAVCCVAFRDLTTRQVPAHIPTHGVALVSFIAVTSLGAVMTVFEGWVPMSMTDFSILCAASVFVIVGYVSIILAMRMGDIAVVAPFRYSIVLWAILLGYFVWGDIPDRWTVFGTVIVILTGIYTFFRERKLSQS